MTTRDKGITLPAAGPYINTAGTSVLVTDASGDYTSKNAWSYGPAFIVPNNPTVLTAVAPASYRITSQNAIAGFSNVGGSIQLQPGIGTGGNSSGNVTIADTAGVSGWTGSHVVMGSDHFWFDANNTLRWKATAPTGDQDGLPVGTNLQVSGTYDAPSLADGVGTTTTIACAGAALGDFVSVSFGVDLAGILVTAYVSAANVVSIRLQNESGGTVDLASTTIRVRVSKQ